MSTSIATTPPDSRCHVPFVSVGHMIEIIRSLGVETAMAGITDYMEADFRRWEHFEKSPRAACHSAEGVIELMPTSDGETYSFKYVNGHPKNVRSGLQTVTAFGALASVGSGYPLLLAEMTILTALRTAATSALAAKYLAPKGATTMAMIGNGAQSEFQALAFKAVNGISEIRLYDIDPLATEKCLGNLEDQDLEVVVCKSVEEAIAGSHIITVCTASKQTATVLADHLATPGIHINAIGGDCPGKTELHIDTLLKSNIIVEYAPQTRIEGEIQQLDADHSVTELWQVITGRAVGRESEEQITLFDGVGFAIEDFSALRYIYDQLSATGLFDVLDLVANPDDPRDLFGMLRRVSTNA